MNVIPPDAPLPGRKPPAVVDPLRQAAAALEVSFLAEMLKSIGMAKPRESFGGGVGEDQFASFLAQEQAERMVAAGGIGLAERLFDSFKERQDAGQ